MTNTLGNVGADHVHDRLETEAVIVVEAWNHFAAGQPFDDKDRLHEVRGGKRSLRAQIAQMRRLPKPQRGPSRGGRGHGAHRHTSLSHDARSSQTPIRSDTPSTSRMVLRVWPGPEACHASRIAGHRSIARLKRSPLVQKKCDRSGRSSGNGEWTGYGGSAPGGPARSRGTPP